MKKCLKWGWCDTHKRHHEPQNLCIECDKNDLSAKKYVLLSTIFILFLLIIQPIYAISYDVINQSPSLYVRSSATQGTNLCVGEVYIFNTTIVLDNVTLTAASTATRVLITNSSNHTITTQNFVAGVAYINLELLPDRYTFAEQNPSSSWTDKYNTATPNPRQYPIGNGTGTQYSNTCPTGAIANGTQISYGSTYLNDGGIRNIDVFFYSIPGSEPVIENYTFTYTSPAVTSTNLIMNINSTDNDSTLLNYTYWVINVQNNSINFSGGANQTDEGITYELFDHIIQYSGNYSIYTNVTDGTLKDTMNDSVEIVITEAPEPPNLFEYEFTTTQEIAFFTVVLLLFVLMYIYGKIYKSTGIMMFAGLSLMLMGFIMIFNDVNKLMSILVILGSIIFLFDESE